MTIKRTTVTMMIVKRTMVKATGDAAAGEEECSTREADVNSPATMNAAKAQVALRRR